MSGTLVLRAGLAGLALAALATGLATPAEAAKVSHVKKAPFGTTVKGEKVQIYTLTNKNGLEARIATYGGTIVSLKTPDKAGKLANIVLGFDRIEPYQKGVPYFGALIGRYGNRLANGTIVIDGQTYKLPQNDGTNTLHGGPKGFDKVVWQAKPYEDKNGPGLKLTYVSADGEMGFPGALTVHVTYQLRNDNALSIDYEATTDKPTVANLTNHSYFNLTGDTDTPILDHLMTINADKITPVDKRLIPTGDLKDVTGTPFDFRKATAIGDRIGADDEQLKLAGGYDHNWVLNQPKPGEEILAAKVVEPKSGRTLEVRTVEPGVQFYAGNFLDGKPAGVGTVFKHRTGFCLETQHYPDSPNQPNFPSTELRPGQVYKTHTVFVFGVEK
jgi:aldose 1-epimerase